MSIKAESVDEELSTRQLLILILRELRLIRLMTAEGNRSSLTEKDINV